jgi:hypothetical protein
MSARCAGRLRGLIITPPVMAVRLADHNGRHHILLASSVSEGLRHNGGKKDWLCDERQAGASRRSGL